MYPLTIKPVDDSEELKLLRNFMLTQSQFYPNYQEWVDGKCISSIESGKYLNLVAIHDNRVIGGCIYRFLDRGSSEIKNFRIDPSYRNRDLGHFLLKHIERETKKRQGTNIFLDVTSNNYLGVQFFIRNGFDISDMKSLYLPNQMEYLMCKKLFP